MTRRAVDVEAFASALEDFLGDREGHDIAGIGTDFAGIEIGIGSQLAAGDCAFNRRARGTVIGIEVAVRQGILTGLHVHVEAAGSGKRRNEYRSNSEQPVELRSTGRPRAPIPTRIFQEVRHSSLAPPRPSVGLGPQGSGECQRRCTFYRTKTRSGRNGLWMRTRNAAR